MVGRPLGGNFQIGIGSADAGFQFRHRAAAGVGKGFQSGFGISETFISIGQFFVGDDFSLGCGAFGARSKQGQSRFLLLKAGFELLLIGVSQTHNVSLRSQVSTSSPVFKSELKLDRCRVNAQQFRRRMSESAPQRRLIVNADDFGRSESINEAVIRAHRDGILTTASLMVNEAAADQAVEMARRHPNLGVGLHLALVCGKAALSPERIPSLAAPNGLFPENAVAAGLKYFFSSKCRAQLRAEIGAQFERFHATGLTLDHINGHLNFHLHPVILGILMENAGQWGIRAMRLTWDPFFLNARIASGQWAYRASHAMIFRLLADWARPRLAAKTIRHTGAVFGLLQNSRVDCDYIEKLLPRLPPGDSELYSHPSLDHFRNEYDALVHPAIRRLLEQQGIRLIRYQDL